MTQNDQIRRAKRQIRRELDTHTKERLSKQISNRLEEYLKKYSEIDTFLCYYPLEDEVDVRSFYETLLSNGKELYFPVTNLEDKKMSFYRVSSLSDFIEGNMGILEPSSREDEFTCGSAISITPGIAFDPERNRIGFGAGFYDRFFGKHEAIIRIGLAFEAQIIPVIPPEPWDIPMHAVITEDRVI